MTLSENIHKMIEISQRHTTLVCSVEKSVIQTTIDETKNSVKTTQVSTIENSKRVVLNDNNSTVTTPTAATTVTFITGIDDNNDGGRSNSAGENINNGRVVSKDLPKESNGGVYVDSMNEQQQQQIEQRDRDVIKDKVQSKRSNSFKSIASSSSFGDLLNIYQRSTAENKATRDQSMSEFSIPPYNIINNYFSIGVVSD